MSRVIKDMPQEFVDSILDLNSKDFDEMIEMWHQGEREKLDYAEQYNKQVDGVNLGNRTFQESKRISTPEEKSAEIDERINLEKQKRKDVELQKQQPDQELTREGRIEPFAEMKKNMFKYNRLNEERSDPSRDKDDLDRDMDRD